jgi:hypothetical protein
MPLASLLPADGPRLGTLLAVFCVVLHRGNAFDNTSVCGVTTDPNASPCRFAQLVDVVIILAVIAFACGACESFRVGSFGFHRLTQ